MTIWESSMGQCQLPTANVCIITKPAHRYIQLVWSLVKLKTELDQSYSIECDHHIDHIETYYTITERNDELFIF